MSNVHNINMGIFCFCDTNSLLQLSVTSDITSAKDIIISLALVVTLLTLVTHCVTRKLIFAS